MTFCRIRLAARDSERAAGILFRAGYSGAYEEDREGEDSFVATFAEKSSARLAQRLLQDEDIPCRLEEDLEALDPFASFRASARPFRVGRFWIDPRGGAPEASPAGAVSLEIPAHCAFGTGLHESTRGILLELDGTRLGECSVLDVGCGSGILAIAAVKCGARVAVGFDTDLEAVFEARRNVSRNRVESGAQLFGGGLEAVSGRFDFILANLIWEELVPILPLIPRRLSDSGTAIFSGLLAEREREAVSGLEAVGLRAAKIIPDGEWRTIRAQKCPGHP